MPEISVILPTFRRPEMLKRAVASVRAQRFDDWELLISDDEDPPGETWDFLAGLAGEDARIRVMRNPGPHGQAGNVNHLLSAARGTWVKPLYDDDVLRPDCLEVFARAVDGRPTVALAVCEADHYVDGRPRRRFHRGRRAMLEITPGPYALLGMYLQEPMGGGTPPQSMVRRTAVEAGAIFETPPGIATTADSLWFIRICTFGDHLCINRALVEVHQGHDTVTSDVPQADLDREMIRLREILDEVMPADLKRPPLKTVQQMLALIRAMHRLSRRKPGEALKLAAPCWRPGAWWLAARWIIHRRWPYVLSALPRELVDEC